MAGSASSRASPPPGGSSIRAEGCRTEAAVSGCEDARPARPLPAPGARLPRVPPSRGPPGTSFPQTLRVSASPSRLTGKMLPESRAPAEDPSPRRDRHTCAPPAPKMRPGAEREQFLRRSQRCRRASGVPADIRAPGQPGGPQRPGPAPPRRPRPPSAPAPAPAQPAPPPAVSSFLAGGGERLERQPGYSLSRWFDQTKPPNGNSLSDSTDLGKRG